MALDQCSRCGQLGSRASLVRCQDLRCPQKQAKPAAPFRMVAALGGAGLLVAGLTGAVLMTAAQPGRRHDAVPDVFPSASPSAGWSAGTASATPHWLVALVSVPARSKPEESPAPVVDRPDPRAAARVQSFSCGNGLLPGAKGKICTDWALATTDYNFELLYRQTLARSAKPEQVRRLHDEWRHELDRLDNKPQSIMDFYSAWFARLSKA